MEKRQLTQFSPIARGPQRIGRWSLRASLGWLRPLLSLSLGLGFAFTAAAPLSGRLALAQTAISEAEIDQYANAILQMESHRSEAYTAISNQLLAANVDLNQVSLGCAESNLSALPRPLRREVEALRIGYCNQARDIVDQNGLTAQRFNEITNAHRADGALGDRVRQVLIRLQQQ
ncbi:MAG: DUF4168 domain-containing protein [Leptolyngbyaceae cyanobacterium]